MIKKIFKYLEPLWLGNDNKISLRSVLAFALTVDFIINVHNCAGMVTKVLYLIYRDKVIDPLLISSMSANLAQIAMILGIEAALIAAMLALKTYQNNITKLSTTTELQTPSPMNEVVS